MKISLLGQFGAGNSGNDGSLEAMLISLRKLRPDAEFVCICSNPDLISARHHIPTMPIGGPALSSRWTRSADRMMLKLPRRLVLVVTALMRLNGFDLMIVPGTGILDDFQEHAFGWPFVVFCWCLLARLCRMRILFVSIGAGPIRGRLSRFFLQTAARMADYRSYRDDFSLEFMRDIGIDVAGDRRYPDIAFSLPTPLPPPLPRSQLSIAVGVMHYRGWRAGDPRSQAIYDDYLTKLTVFLCWLVEKQFRVHLVTGDAADRKALNDLLARLSKLLDADDLAAIEIGSAASLHDVMVEMSKVDLAIVSRYHNLVCSLMLRKPTASLGYARKNDDLMGEFQQARYCFHIETFQVDDLKTTLYDLLDNRLAIGRQMQRVKDRLQKQLLEQETFLNDCFLRIDSHAAAAHLKHSLLQ